MLFTKSAPHVGRSALAAQAKSKKFWASNNQAGSQPSHPSFFVSTPQFVRHSKSQISPHFEDSHAGSSDPYGIDNPYIALTAGATGGAAAHALLFEDDKEDLSQTRVSTRPVTKQPLQITLTGTNLPPLKRTAKTARPCPEDIDKVVEQIDQQSTATVIDGVLAKMHRLQQAGSHTAVLQTFESAEASQVALPIDAYNIVLESLVLTSDVTMQLQAYERMLQRGLVPNTTTYCILLNSLADTADQLVKQRLELKPIIGSNTMKLESVAEIYESLAAEEYLVLAQTILQAILTAHPDLNHELQACLDRIVDACVELNCSVPPILLDATHPKPETRIQIQPNIQLAASEFTALSSEEQNSQGAQSALLNSYFRFREPQGAIAFYSGCGAPQYLLKPLISGFAASGYLATARRWSEKVGAGADVVGEALQSVPLEDAKHALPSATRMFYQMAGRNGGGSGNNPLEDMGGRCAFLRLCVAAENREVLLMAIRESRICDAAWDATTISDVSNFLSEVGEPLLAADICSWQALKLAEAHEKKHLKSFLGQEVVSNVVNDLRQRDQLSLDAAFRLLPVVALCSASRNCIVSTIASARLAAPHEVSKLMDASKLAAIITVLAGMMLSKVNRLTGEELSTLKPVFPLFVEDFLSLNGTLEQAADVNTVLDALQMCHDSAPLIHLWVQRQPAVSRRATSTVESSMAIQRYALAPNGLDHALKLLKDEVRLGRNVSTPTLESVLASCVQHNATDVVPELFDLLPATQSTLNALAATAAEIGNFDVLEKCRFTLKSLGEPMLHATYTRIMRAARTQPKLVMELFTEAKDAGIKLDADTYNYVLQSLAHDHLTELNYVLQEMAQLQFPISPQTYGPLLSMHVRNNDGYAALEMLKSMTDVTKSLLEVKYFNHLMNYFVHVKPDRNAALAVFVELRSTGTLATSFTYRLLMETYLLHSASEVPNLDNADRVLSLMRKDGAPITNQCFATLLRARGVICKDFESARDFYRGLIKSSRVLPDRRIFKALLESYITNGHQAELGLVLDEMKRYHVTIDDEIARMARV